MKTKRNPSLTVPHVSSDPIEITGDAKELRFAWAEEYSPPDLSYKILRDFVEFFGTEEIDTSDTINERGCETCDHGSKYGFYIVVTNATKNNPFKDIP